MFCFVFFFMFLWYKTFFRGFSRHFCPKRLTFVHTYIQTLMAVAVMQGADQHIRSSLGFSILPKGIWHAEQGNWTINLQITRRWLYPWANVVCIGQTLWTGMFISFLDDSALDHSYSLLSPRRCAKVRKQWWIPEINGHPQNKKNGGYCVITSLLIKPCVFYMVERLLVNYCKPTGTKSLTNTHSFLHL